MISCRQQADESLHFDEQILEAAKSIAGATAALVKAASLAQRELVAQGKVGNDCFQHFCLCTVWVAAYISSQLPLSDRGQAVVINFTLQNPLMKTTFSVSLNVTACFVSLTKKYLTLFRGFFFTDRHCQSRFWWRKSVVTGTCIGCKFLRNVII